MNPDPAVLDGPWTGRVGQLIRRRVAHPLFRALIRRLPDRAALQLTYLRRFGRFINFEQPKTLTEKINWRKLYQRDPRFRLYSDKFTSKELVAQRVGAQHVIPNLWSGDSPDEIPFAELPLPYVIKTNHSCNTNIFVRTPADLDPVAIRRSLTQWLAAPYAPLLREWGYQGITPRILVEPMLLTADGKPPEDFKCFVYDGRVRFIQCDRDRFGRHTRAYFTSSWQRLAAKVLYPQIEAEVARPERLEEMLTVAEAIGSAFDFVRVDLYQHDGAVYFGEATFYPGGGFDPFEPAEWDAAFGAPWNLPPASRRYTDRAEDAAPALESRPSGLR
jgi:hypothetical protein